MSRMNGSVALDHNERSQSTTATSPGVPLPGVPLPGVQQSLPSHHHRTHVVTGIRTYTVETLCLIAAAKQTHPM